jgi:uncharacterized protein YbdZ (MbtH family)
MAVIVIGEMPNGTAEQDAAMMKEMGVEASPPKGVLFRAAGPMPGGWRIVSVWESLEAFQAFFQERMNPVLKASGQTPQFHIWPAETVRIPPR